MSIREQIHDLADQLAEDATWDDVAYEIYVRQSVAQGLADIKAGRTVPAEEAKAYLQAIRSQRARSLEQ